MDKGTSTEPVNDSSVLEVSEVASEEKNDGLSAAELHAQQDAQLEEIRLAAASAPMISDLFKPDILAVEYADASNNGFIKGVEYLSGKYVGLRKTRGDGNCFYRSFLFSYLEKLLLLSKDDELKAVMEKSRISEILKDSRSTLVNVGYQEGIFETFIDMLQELLDGLFTMTRDTLQATFQEDGESDYYTWFMRLLTAGSMRMQEERFAPFIEFGADIAGFCQREVEPMGKECEQVQIIALTEYLKVPVSIEYLDGHAFDPAEGLSVVEVGGNDTEGPPCPFNVTLLYRPGHYDILYS
jgi:ubiquitin thioesterase protein OTUB1